MGRTSNPYKYLSKATMFILSSRYEGFPNALIESIACSCPSISFDCNSGPNEIITDGDNGLLVKSGDIVGLKNAMEKVYFNKKLQDKFSTNSAKLINDLDIKKIVRKWYSIL